jgi:RNA ligase (TIGR02306 family)
MSNFEVLIDRIAEVHNHDNADRLSVFKVRGYTLVGAKLEDGSHRYNVGDLVIYVPEAGIVPEYLLRQGFWDEEKNKGMLHGKDGNIVKSVKLRGETSTGIMFPVQVTENNTYWIEHESGDQLIVKEGDNVAEFLGITKYEAPIPAAFAGDVINIGTNRTFNFDVENILKYQNVFKDGEEVVVKPKIHGTFCVLGWVDYEINELVFNHCFTSSKGMFAQGLVFKDTRQNNESNLYVKTLNRLDAFYKLNKYISEAGIDKDINSYYILGEVYGTGVQDLTYSEPVPTFKVFNIVKRYKDNTLYWLSESEIQSVSTIIGLSAIQPEYIGPYNFDAIEKYRNGKEKDGKTIREGVVINAANLNVKDDKLGRRQLKFINPEYLTRKSKNGAALTEFQ